MFRALFPGLFSFSSEGAGPMWLLVGLGNPGEKYARNRHNAGFMAVDAIAAHFGFAPFRLKFQGEFAEGVIGGQKAGILKPMTYMNESGQSIGKVSSFYKIDPSCIIIFHDELDLNPGQVRVKMGGGNAGHNGLKSAQAHLGVADFWRVRIGIGHPGHKDRVSGYVLSDFSKAETEWAGQVCQGIADNFETLMSGNPDEFASRVTIAADSKTVIKKG